MFNIFNKAPKNTNTKIVFSINNGESNIDINWKNNDEETLRELSLLLFYINKGFLMRNILDKLKDIANNNESKKDFIINLIKNWDTCYQYEENSSVLVKPSMAFYNNVKTK